MSRQRDKRAAFVLALLLVLVFAFGQAQRASADRRAATDPAARESLASGNAAAVLHD
ncbi:MAG: hypothetical protein IPO18_00095 [bacterium]|jgi:hypothetical protein|nr:hypothetical protein [bacterium]MBK7048569.1 hypothetical protein [bacterium]MBK7190151.1 hypothetical protein [bacterium]MBK7669944.1 hypothetical protein [bacterium]MBK7771896.1 hypothetical protein [bacterium]